MRRRLIVLLAIAMVGSSVSVWPIGSTAAPIATDPFQRTWERTDQPVAGGQVSRTWMWGPEPFTEALQEEYAESPGSQRTVQYFDKSRMEISDPDADQSSAWYVTNGLLVVELISGLMQIGDDQFVERSPAQVNVAGDADDPLTYASLGGLLGAAPTAEGITLTQRIDAQGQVSNDADLAQYGVTAATHVPETNHAVASPFWGFMTSSGAVWDGEQLVTGPLFESPYYATGLPITEAYWAEVKVGGTPKLVLVQCFERRCLTYTPDNPEGWQVEAGNVGQHYHTWRYAQPVVEVEPGPSEQANQLAAAVAQAGSDEARYQALLQVMDVLHVGVYSGQGEMILGGAERGPSDFYLYDIELRMMAGAIGRGQTWGIVDLAMQLTAMELLPEGETLDPEIARQAVLRGIAAASATPQEFTSLSPLIVRQLGLTQSPAIDLFDDLPLAEIRLDALAFFLVLADIAVPLAADQLPVQGATSNLVAQFNGILKPSTRTLQGICDPATFGFEGDAFKNAWGFEKMLVEVARLVPEAIGKGTVILDALHGAILAFSVGVTELDQRLETHYGHESAGQPITFRIKVEMRDELLNALVDCGWIAGTDFPPKGPISGVSVHWFWDSLDEHGQVNCGSVCGQTPGNGVAIEATDASGIAQMTFQPKNEETTGEGSVVEEHGIVTGVALYQSKFTNLLGSYGQYLTPKSGATRWVVKWHEVPGWDVTMKLNYDVRRTHAEDWYWWAKGAMTFQARIEWQGFSDQNGWLAEVSGSGSGTYGYTTNPPVSCSWSGAWGWPTTVVEIIDRDQLLVDFIGTVGPMPGSGSTTHPLDGDCSIAADMGFIPPTFPPAFSLKKEGTQIIEVAPEGTNNIEGTITWEITVTPFGQP